MKSCKWCLWDITKDDQGRWRLAWLDLRSDVDPYDCAGHPGHQP